MSRPSWEREAEFRALLQRCAAKASREGLETLADIAVRDDKARPACFWLRLDEGRLPPLPAAAAACRRGRAATELPVPACTLLHPHCRWLTKRCAGC